jgi:hypothetical protein
VALVIAMFGPCRADYPEKPIRLLLLFLPAGPWTLSHGW